MYQLKRSAIGIVASIVLGGVLAGCGLFDEATAVSIATEWQEFALDIDAMGIKAPGAVKVPKIDCSSVDICAAASDKLSCSADKYACGLQCKSGACEMFASVQESSEVDISKEVEGKTSADALSEAELTSVSYNTDTNTLNFATPKLSLYVGPANAKLVTDPGVELLAALDSIAPGEDLDEELVIEEAGKRALVEFVKDYKTPFRVMVQAELSFGAGQELPAGRYEGKIKAYFKVDFLD